MARVLANDFECAWESLGPVPKVEIDFGNGKTLETTLGGNVLTSLCMPDGTVIDVLPGVVTPRTYLNALIEARDFVRDVAKAGEQERAKSIREYPLKDDMTKGWWEYVMKWRVRGSIDEIRPFPVQSRAPGSMTVTISKSAGEMPIVDAIATPNVRDDVSLIGDDLLVQTTLRPQARGVLAALHRKTPAELTPHVYRLVLKTELDDPYLGLGKSLVGDVASSR